MDGRPKRATTYTLTNVNVYVCTGPNNNNEVEMFLISQFSTASNQSVQTFLPMHFFLSRGSNLKPFLQAHELVSPLLLIQICWQPPLFDKHSFISVKNEMNKMLVSNTVLENKT